MLVCMRCGCISTVSQSQNDQTIDDDDVEECDEMKEEDSGMYISTDL